MEVLQRKKNWERPASYIIIVTLTIVVALLILQNRDLKSYINTLAAQTQTDPLKPGDRAEPMNVQLLDGVEREVKFDDPSKKYLLFVLSTTCPHCEKTLPAWQSIANSGPENCDILGVSIHTVEETKAFLTAKNVGFYTVSVKNDTSFNRKYKISGVPETILINGNGIVEKAWVGELTEAHTNEILKLMNATTALAN